ncbi:hypothetical protein J5N97_005096 [Dioscorea zingiberensis]|uniref:CCHC-type domain-containing protein n=1 Tax=Dioscorea zingiberensis TaxID=325984 RepID=A0A9D5D9V0_9LILI|nr:hypothetical protein J5N97_005096 [Dioscorea zingiberensis]
MDGYHNWIKQTAGGGHGDGHGGGEPRHERAIPRSNDGKLNELRGEADRRLPKRKPSPSSLRNNGRHVQDPRAENRGEGETRLRRRELTYVEALSERDSATPPPPPQMMQDDGGGWKKVINKKRRRLSGGPRRDREEQPTLHRRSPPTIRTPKGTINVCGQCLHPGHRAEECRRMVTCRQCGEVGHKGLVCTGARRKMDPNPPSVQKPNKHQHQPATKPLRQPAMKTIKEPATKASPDITHSLNGKTKTPDMEPETMEHHFISLAHDTDMEAGLESMSRFTIARVKETRGGVVNNNHIEALLKTRMKEQWEWSARTLLDGRYLIECTLAETARQMEKAGPMESLPFTLVFTPWMTDLYRPAKAEGALRWIQKPRCSPKARIHCNLRTLQHAYIVELEAGQPPLSWDSRRRTEQEQPPPPGGRKPREQDSNLHHPLAKPPANNIDKGKAPLTEPEPTPARSGGRLQRGIIIREQEEAQHPHRPEHTTPTSNPSTGDEQRRTTDTPAMIVPDGDAAKKTAEETPHCDQDMTCTGLEDEATTHATHNQKDDSPINGQHTLVLEEMDFEATIMALTATWGPTSDPRSNPGSDRNPDKLVLLSHSNPPTHAPCAQPRSPGDCTQPHTIMADLTHGVGTRQDRLPPKDPHDNNQTTLIPSPPEQAPRMACDKPRDAKVL